MDKKSYEIRKRVIAAVRRRRAIYDTRVKEHKIVHLKEKAWADAAQEVNMSINDTKITFQSLRQRYSRELRKVRHGVAPEDIDKMWPFYKHLGFLYEFVKPRKRGCPNIENYTNMSSYDDSIDSPQESSQNMSHDDPLDDDTDYLKDAIIMESDASNVSVDSYEEKPVIQAGTPEASSIEAKTEQTSWKSNTNKSNRPVDTAPQDDSTPDRTDIIDRM
uniref:Uncharacterized protein n=1 Tax=Phlebotomus papatasi TaxID=29031 RepID=A0A1B0GNN1_PHLPP